MTRCPDVIIIWLLIELLWTDLVVLSTYKSQKIWSVFLEQARQKSRRKLHQNTAVRLKVSASLHRDHTRMAYRYERSQRQQDSTFLQYLLAQNLHSPRRRQQMLDIIWHRRSRRSCTYQKCSLVGEFALCNKWRLSFDTEFVTAPQNFGKCWKIPWHQTESRVLLDIPNSYLYSLISFAFELHFAID